MQPYRNNTTNNSQNPNSQGQGGRGPRKGGFKGRRPGPDTRNEFEQKVIDIARVTRVTKGGKRFSFRTTIIIGDGRSKVGMGIGKGTDVAQSVQKAYNRARKHMITVTLVNGTIPYEVRAKYNSAIVLLKPAKGGVKAGGAVRVVSKLGGIKSLTGKLLGRTNNKINIAMATFKALESIRLLKKQVKSNKEEVSPEPVAAIAETQLEQNESQ